jgi:hypothetical protein
MGSSTLDPECRYAEANWLIGLDSTRRQPEYRRQIWQKLLGAEDFGVPEDVAQGFREAEIARRAPPPKAH